MNTDTEIYILGLRKGRKSQAGNKPLPLDTRKRGKQQRKGRLLNTKNKEYGNKNHS